jgi:TonB family protein
MAASTVVEVAINPDGTLLDAWVWGPSGIPQFDAEALRAAKASTYTGARGYCRPVPGEYFFRVTFAPN